MQGRRAFEICHPSFPILRLSDGAGEVVPVLSKCTIGKRKLARGIERTLEGGSKACTGPVLATLPILGTELVQGFLSSPSLLVVQAMCE